MFNLRNIVFIESSFTRKAKIDFQNNSELENILVVDSKGQHDDKGKISVELSVSINGVLGEETIFEIKAKAVGMFNYKKKEDDPILDLETFEKVNGPAIIFPFIREHVASMALKGGLGQILLQPVDFTIRNRPE